MKRIAMWSGPRNISTALMRSFENRADTEVVDEPLYAYYLSREPVDHPGRDEIVDHYNCNYNELTKELSQGDEPGTPIYYQKHMAHHVFFNDDLQWINNLSNVFLVRRPVAMLTSLMKVLGNDIEIDQTGLPQQMHLLKHLQAGGHSVVVVDSDRLLQSPPEYLTKLCAHLGIAFDQNMLNWPRGPRQSDGIWAKYWYASVESSTAFAPPVERDYQFPEEHTNLLAQCEELYTQLLNFEIQ